MKIGDHINAHVECTYSSIGEEWNAELIEIETGLRLAYARAQTRAQSLRDLADKIEGS